MGDDYILPLQKEMTHAFSRFDAYADVIFDAAMAHITWRESFALIFRLSDAVSCRAQPLTRRHGPRYARHNDAPPATYDMMIRSAA